MIILNRYEVLERIGKGCFGDIFMGRNIRNDVYVAIKVEKISSETKMLKNETKIYHYLSGNNGIPNILWFGKDDYNYYMVMELLGVSLQKVKETRPSFSLKSVSTLIGRIVEILEYIHAKRLIHRDIKPDNFMFGENDKKHNIYLIDFGFCKKYILDNGQHIECRTNRKMIGTPNFVSINIHDGIEASRRDDLESVVYIMYYLWNGSTKMDQ